MPQTDTLLLDKTCDFILSFFKVGSLPEAPLAGSKHISGQEASALPYLLQHYIK